MRTPDIGRDERAPFPAKITARTSSGGRYYYSWTEQVDAPAGYMDAAPARSGSDTMNPAFEVNNSSVSTGTYVRMWIRSGQGGGGRPDMAQGGGPDGGRAADAIAAVKSALMAETTAA